MFLKRYVGTAGVLTSLNRIITKLLVPNEKVNTLIFFIMSGITLLLCLMIHQAARRTQLVRHYTTACQNAGLGEDERSLQLSTEVIFWKFLSLNNLSHFL